MSMKTKVENFIAKITPKALCITTAVIIAIIILAASWALWGSKTRIGFMNFQAIQLGQISKANTNNWITIREISPEDLDGMKNCDMLFINGMGLRITEQMRANVLAYAKKSPVMTVMATNPANRINSLDSLHIDTLQTYLSNGSRKNYKSLLNYVRNEIDGKVFFTEEPEPAVHGAYEMLYHPDVDNLDNEPLGFDYYYQYVNYLQAKGLWKEGAPRILITGQMGEPSELISSLEATGNVVIPVRNFNRFRKEHLVDSVAPSAIINMAHGRMGDALVRTLEEYNIPLFSPLYVNALVEDWENDKMGMVGGFLSQSVVTPEIDGAIRPYALFGHYLDDEGLPQTKAIKGRLETFVETVNNYLSLKSKSNADKKVAIVYYKGVGQSALTASGMEVIPSLYNLLKRLRSEGYKVTGLPTTLDEFKTMIMHEGAVFGTYAEGAASNFMKTAHPLMVKSEDYQAWVDKSIRPEKYAEVTEAYGEFPGDYMSNDQGELAVSRLDFGNVVLLPQPAAGTGSDTFKMVHGTDAAPTHAYLAPYLWIQHGFQADALIHFGTHGSLEFTPRKQVALSSNDWPDVLVGSLPHYYIYTIGNVGEAMIAKRRSYAGIQSYLTPPFMETSLRGTYRKLSEAIRIYNNSIADGTPAEQEKNSLKVKDLTVQMGIHRDLRLDSTLTVAYTEEEIARIENFAEELATEKITGQLYTMGVPYSSERIESSVYAMTVEPIAYRLLAIDKERGLASADVEKHKSLFNAKYLEPSRQLVRNILSGRVRITDDYVFHIGNRSYKANDAMKNVLKYRQALLNSPEKEMTSLVNALNGGYTSPTPGGDPIVNPNTLPTGRNLYAINAEETPTESAWDKGKRLAQSTIDMYRRNHNDSIPRKVSYTLWSGEFIETEGATIAQILYMLGVEPVRDVFGRVSDIRLIPSEELGRPRIDVVVQTSGQLRDIAASRLFLINRAVEMAAAAKDDVYANQVYEGAVEAERILVDKGVSPKDAREISFYRVFGGTNGNYGTGIQAMVQSGDRWDDESQIANVYLNNMGAFYGNEKQWETVRQYAFEAALANTDAVIQPRQSNTWGALSLDHVYEFMGGLNLAVRNVTGKDPDAYLSDYRNHNNVRMQELKESIGVESRTTLFNPNYIKEKMKGDATAAAGFGELVQNTYGWNVMKPDAVDDQVWDQICDVYVRDVYNLGIKEFFEKANPATLQDMTAVMLETARKGLWNASDDQLSDIAELHTDLVKRYAPACTGAVCDNVKLRDFIASKVAPEKAVDYQSSIRSVRERIVEDDGKGMVMKKESMTLEQQTVQQRVLNGVVVAVVVIVVFVGLVLLVRHRRRQL